MDHTGPLGKPIAIGRTAEVYRWNDGWVVKLYRPPWKESAEREARIGRAVHAAHLPVPAVGDVVSVGERIGLLYEYVRGESLLGLMRRQPWATGRYSRLLADLHVHVHAHDIHGLPAQRDGLIHAIRAADGLNDAGRQRLLQVVQHASGRQCLCHGDLHPGNVMMAADGPVIIDWINATRGHPLVDVARTALLIRVGLLKSSRTPNGLRALWRARFRGTYLRRYVTSQADAKIALDAWSPVVAAARLSERVPGEREWLLRVAARI